MRATVDESPCVPDKRPCASEEELEELEDEAVVPAEEEPEEDEGVVPEEEPEEDEAVVLVLLLVCDVEESRTSKLSHIQSFFFSFSKR